MESNVDSQSSLDYDGPEVRGKLETFLTVKNNSESVITTTARWIDKNDWKGDNRPDKNFNNLTINPNVQMTKQEDINTSAKGNMYILDLKFNKGKITLRCDQGIAKKFKKDFRFYEVESGITYIKNIHPDDGELYIAFRDSTNALYFKDKKKMDISENSTDGIGVSVQVLGNHVIIIVYD